VNDSSEDCRQIAAKKYRFAVSRLHYWKVWKYADRFTEVKWWCSDFISLSGSSAWCTTR
jgi:hypothetical protein